MNNNIEQAQNAVYRASQKLEIAIAEDAHASALASAKDLAKELGKTNPDPNRLGELIVDLQNTVGTYQGWLRCQPERTD